MLTRKAKGRVEHKNACGSGDFYSEGVTGKGKTVFMDKQMLPLISVPEVLKK